MPKFSNLVKEKLGYYVYSLQNPIDNKVFYIGKGRGDRVYSHAREVEKKLQDTNKHRIITKINKAKKQVNYFILRHGLTEREAFEIESSLIDFVGLKNLSGNLVMGHQSDDRGKMTDDDVIEKYSAKEVKITEPSILINLNKTYTYGMSASELYEITSGDWKVGTRRSGALYAFAVYRGIIKAVYKISSWKQLKSNGRWYFVGQLAESKIQKKYIPGTVKTYFAKGAQNPIKYVNC